MENTILQEISRLGGKFFNARFDPRDPPEYIRCRGVMKLGREYLLSTQELDIYGTASAYHGPVLILHGSKDSIVPLWCSERYKGKTTPSPSAQHLPPTTPGRSLINKPPS